MADSVVCNVCNPPRTFNSVEELNAHKQESHNITMPSDEALDVLEMMSGVREVAKCARLVKVMDQELAKCRSEVVRLENARSAAINQLMSQCEALAAQRREQRLIGNHV